MLESQRKANKYFQSLKQQQPHRLVVFNADTAF